MAKDEEDDLLPDKDAAKGFYAKYEPKEILGRGISSTVRRCIEKETGKEFAAKIIDLGAATEAGESNPQHMLDATRQEIAILRQVMGHSYIIDLQDVFESDAFVFLVFELCPKGELFDYLTSVVTLSEKKTRTIMRQILEGVEYIHAKNIVHRDLKPENILLDDNHNVKITDFGFARQLGENEKLTDLCGTPGYLAPETLKCNMFEGSPGYSKEVDIWACGVIMFTLLVGCPPFWHRKQMVMLRNIMEGKYSFTSPEWGDISEDPKDLIRKCLVVDPAQRITVKEALGHPFFNQMVLLEEPAVEGQPRRYQLKQQTLRHHHENATNYPLKKRGGASLEVVSLSRPQPPLKSAFTNNVLNGNQAAPPSSSTHRTMMMAVHCDDDDNDDDDDDDDDGSDELERRRRRQQGRQKQQQQQQWQPQQQQNFYYHPSSSSSSSQQCNQREKRPHQRITVPSATPLAIDDCSIEITTTTTTATQQYLCTQKLRRQSRFNARKKFQFAILVIRAVIRIRRLRYTAEPLHVEEAIRDPYRVKVLRKVIDGCAFRVYGHWVKKGEGQNRAALFENMPRTELHALYINNLSR